MFNINKSKSSDNPVPSSLPNTLADKTDLSSDVEAKKEENNKQDPPSTKTPKTFKELFSSEDNSSPKNITVKSETKGVDSKQSESVTTEDSLKLVDLKDLSNKKMDRSFFEELEKRFEEEKSLIENHFSSDIMKKMKEFHSSKGSNYFLDESTADNGIYSLLFELKGLESAWSLRFKELEAAKEAFEITEQEVTKKLAEFELALKKKRHLTLFNKKVPEENKFILNSGVSVNSVKGLLFELRHMPDEVFNHHVTADRNDFANWVDSSLGASELAKEISKMESKADLINLLGSH